MGFYNSRIDGVGSGQEAARAIATKMAGGLTVQEGAQIAAGNEVWNSVVARQRWWRTVKGRNATIRQETSRIVIQSF